MSPFRRAANTCPVMTESVKYGPARKYSDFPTSALALLGGLLFVGCTAELGAEDGDSMPFNGTGDKQGEGEPTHSGAPGFEPAGGIKEIECDPSSAHAPAPRIWRLTRRQYDGTVKTLLGDESQPARAFVPEPGSEQGFQNDAYSLRVRSLEAGQYQAAARTLASQAVNENLERIFPCATSDLDKESCQLEFVNEFGARAFRRPLSAEESERYMSLLRLGASKADAKLGLSVTIEAMLQSPYFLYRFELGDFDPESPGAVVLSEDEIANALAYLLTDSPPDDALRTAIAEEDLTDPSVRQAQAERLLSTHDARDAQIEFYRQLFEYVSLDEVMKAAEEFPEFETLRPKFHQEFDAYTEHVLFESDASLRTLLTANYTFADAELGEFLGLNISNDGFTQTPTPAEQRAGVLSLGGFNAVTSAHTRTSPVNRGRFIREKLLCSHIEEPPEGVDLNLPRLDPNMTAREQLEERTSPPACAGCHSVMNPIGFGMESLDALGRFRTEENDLPIDDRGELTETRDIDGPFQGVSELADRLASSQQVAECVAIQAFRYAAGRGETVADSCALVELRGLFDESGGSLKQLPIAFAASEQFINRDGTP